MNKLKKAEVKPIQRNSSIELLRIISMLMIVFCHFASHGDFSYSAQETTVSNFWWLLIESGGNLGVDIFVLISGYFLVSSTKFYNLSKILKMWGQIAFYSVSIYAVFLATGMIKPGIKDILMTLFPITFESWWFASTYFFLYFIHPFINMLLQKLDKSAYQKLLIIMIGMWCVVRTLTTRNMQSNNLIWFITLYCIAGYIRIYNVEQLDAKKSLILFSACWLMRYLSAVALTIIGSKISIAYEHRIYFYDKQSILTLLSAITIFMFFEKLKMQYHNWINTIGSATFGVYLIHDNNYIRPFLWKTIFKNANYQKTWTIIPYSIAVSTLVFIVCVGIDLTRKQFLEKPYLSLINKSKSIIIEKTRKPLK